MKVSLTHNTSFPMLPRFCRFCGRHHKKGHLQRNLAAALFLSGVAPLLLSMLTFCSEHKSPSPHQEEVRLSGRAFGTSYHVTIRGGLKRGDSKNKIQQKLHNLINKLDASMSNWKPKSTINRINQSRPYQKIPIDPDFQRVYLHAKLLYKKTNHVFDPGSAALFELWNFRTDTDHQHIHTIPKSGIPSKREIRRQIRLGGMKNFVLSHGKLYRTNSQVKLNLSALAKGYLVDQMFLLLQKQGYPELLVEVGGEVRVGTPIQEANWKIGIEEPRYNQTRSLLFVAHLKNHAMATSGDYRNYFRIKGDPSQKIYSHIINPRTGRPKKLPLVSATVLGPECMTADALATTLLLLSPQKGLRLLDRFPDYEALLLEKLPGTNATHKRASQEAQKKRPLANKGKNKENNIQNTTNKIKESIKKINHHAKGHGFAVYMSPGMPAFVEPF